MKIREARLEKEFQRMCALSEQHPHMLFNFTCADLSVQEAAEFLKSTFDAEVIKQAMPGYLSPAEFQRKYPGRAPEKYLIKYLCRGLVKTDTGEIRTTEEHVLNVIFKYDYPSKPPLLVWLTPIWHPNIKMPYICTQGRSFAVGVTLEQIVLTIGAMVQYRNYNVREPLDHDAAAWAREHLAAYLPVDNRDLLDGRQHVPTPIRTTQGNAEPLVEVFESPGFGEDEAEPLIEVIG